MGKYLSKKKLCNILFKSEYAGFCFKNKKIKRRMLVKIYKYEDRVEFLEMLTKVMKKNKRVLAKVMKKK